MTGTVPSCGVMDGLVVVKKEAGWTSHDVVARIRRLLGGIKVGHAGTLDPAATGVLPMLVGKGTRIAEYLMEWDKEYRAVIRFGETTDTQDATGVVLSRRSTEHVTAEMIREAAGRFRGPLQQVPPMYSAVKVDGVPLYKSARAGKTVDRVARAVIVSELEVLEIQGRDVTIRVVCSKGTYVRTLCADFGTDLGVGAHLLSLERTRVGPMRLDQSLTVEEIASRHALGRLGEDVWSLDRVLEDLPALVVDEPTASRVCHGVPVSVSRILRWEPGYDAWSKSERPVRIHDTNGRLLAIGRWRSEAHESVAIKKMLIGQA